MTTINLKAAGGTVAGYAVYWTDPNGFEARRAMGKTSDYDDWVLGSKDKVHDGASQMWDHLTHMDAYEAGNLTFDIASMFVGAGEVKALAKGGSFISKFNKVVKMEKLAAWADKGMDMARLADHGMDAVRLEKLGVKGETLTKLATLDHDFDFSGVSLHESL